MKKCENWLATGLCLISAFSCFSVYPANFYWVNGTGNWNEYTTHWATTSGGGVFHSNAPTSADDVFFDANSFLSVGIVVTINVDATCNNMSWTGALNNPSLSGISARKINIYGSLTLIAGMSIATYTGDWYFLSTSAGNTITSAGNTFKDDVRFDGSVGSWTLSDAITVSDILEIYTGTFNTGNFAVSCGHIDSDVSSTRVINLGSSTVTITVSSSLYGIDMNTTTGLTFNAGTSLINFSNPSARTTWIDGTVTFYDVSFASGSYNVRVGDLCSFHNITLGNNLTEFYMWGSGASAINDLIVGNSIGEIVIYSNMTLTTAVDFGTAALIDLQGSNTFTDVSFSANSGLIFFRDNNSFSNLTIGSNNTLTLEVFDTQTITGILNADGNCEGYIYIQSSNNGIQANINSNSTPSFDNIIIQDINSSGNNITCESCATIANNSGAFTFNNSKTSRTLYWRGNSGNWGTAANWTTNSDGTPSGNTCIPNYLDDVLFNAAAFNGASQTVTLDQVNATCNNFDWSAADETPILSGTNELAVKGDFILFSSLTYSHTGNLYFDSRATGKKINSSGRSINATINFRGAAGGWNLESDLDANNGINIMDGTFDVRNVATTNSYDININGSWSNTGGTFNERAKKVTFDGNISISIIYESGGFYDLYSSKDASVFCYMGVNFTVSNDMFVTSGEFQVSGKTLTVSGEIYISSGEFDLTTGSVTTPTLIQITGGTFDMNGGTFRVDNDINNGDFVISSGLADIDGGSLTIGDDILISGTGKIEFTGATMTVEDLNAAVEYGVVISGGELQVDGGTINVGDGTNEDIVISGGTFDQNGGTVDVKNKFSMSSGKLEMGGGILNIGVAVSVDGTDRLYLTGGTYDLTGGTIDIKSSGGTAFNNVVNVGAGCTVGTITDGGNLIKISAQNLNSVVMVNNAKKIANFEIDASVSYDVELADHLDCDGYVKISTGDLDPNAYDIELTGDWTNNSIATAYLVTNEMVTFNSSSAASQNINGAFSTTFHDLVINNTATNGLIDLDIATTVNGTVTFTSGDIESKDFTLTITDVDDPGMSGGSAASHINGTVAKTYSSTTMITFPLGDGTNYNPLQLTPSASSSQIWTVSYTAGTTPDNSNFCEITFDHIAEEYYWSISRSAAVNAIIKLFWNSSNLVNESNITDGELTIAHLNSTCFSGSPGWELAPGNTATQFTKDVTDNVLPNTLGSIVTVNYVTGFSPFTFSTTRARADQPLPVTDIKFSALYDKPNAEVKLFWESETEVNTEYFEIQRYFDCKNFESIGMVDASGNSSISKQYYFIDGSVNAAEFSSGKEVYYRLKIVDFDGKSDYSQIKSVLISSEFTPLRIFPNPTVQGDLVSLEGGNIPNQGRIKIFDISGKIWVEQKITEKNQKRFEVPATIPQGIYFFRINDDSGNETTLKLIVN